MMFFAVASACKDDVNFAAGNHCKWATWHGYCKDGHSGKQFGLKDGISQQHIDKCCACGKGKPAPRVCANPQCKNPSRWAGPCCAPAHVSAWGWCGGGDAYKSGIDCSDCCGGRREGEDSVPGSLNLAPTVVNGEHVVEKSHFFVPYQVHQYAGARWGLEAQTVFALALVISLAGVLAAGNLYKICNRKETVQPLLASKTSQN